MEEKLTTTTTTRSTFLPQEIVMEILSCLPANFLSSSSFKLVCKTWCTLIQDPDFIKMHLSRGRVDGEGRISGNSLICKSGNEFFQLYPPFNFAKKLDLDLDLDLWGLSISRLVGSCNGLLCLSANDDKNIILLNPSTRRYKISPIQPIEYPKGCARTGETYGFGCCYNPTTNLDEYKVVRIVYFISCDKSIDHRFLYRSQVYVYCMSSNSWRRPETKIRDYYAFSISSRQFGVFVNEALHWVAASLGGNFDTVGSFDIRDEEFRQVPIPLPSCGYDDEPYFKMHEVILMNMKGCLSMIRPSHGRRNLKEEEAADLEIWVMKEYGIKESWTKGFVIRSWDTDPPWALGDILISSWISRGNVLKGDQILMERLIVLEKQGCRPLERFRSPLERFRKLVLYDINKRKINGDFKMIGVPDETIEPYYPQPHYPHIDLVDYIETLVSLKSSIMAGVLL